MIRISTRRALMGIAAMGAIAIALAGCGPGSSSTGKESKEANAGINLILTNQPVPVFASSAMRQALIEIEAVQALGTPTTSFFMPMGSTGTTATPISSCASEGMPIPFGTSLSNPHQVTTLNNNGTDLGGTGNVIDQMEPSGIYPGGNSSGTYVLCDNKTGKAQPSYWEGPVFAVPGTATFDTTSHSVVQSGPDVLPVCTLEGSGSQAHYHCVKAPGT
jgi:hypothetical protein